MNSTCYCYTFRSDIPFKEIESTLLMAVFGAEALLGEARVRLDSRNSLDRTNRTCALGADTATGKAINRLFAGYLSREFGDSAYQVRRTLSASSFGAMAQVEGG